VRKLLQLCLEKNASSRRQTAADLRVDLEQALKEPSAGDVVAARESGGNIGWKIAAAMFALAFLALAAVHFTAKAPEASEIRVDIDTPSSAAPFEFALSPDHRSIAFIASGDGPQTACGSVLWIKPRRGHWRERQARIFHFGSPDSRSIGFFAEGSSSESMSRADRRRRLVKRRLSVAAHGTVTARFCLLRLGRPLARIAAKGGDPVPVTHLAPQQTSHRFPQFLPAGVILFFITPAAPIPPGFMWLRWMAASPNGSDRRIVGRRILPRIPSSLFAAAR